MNTFLCSSPEVIVCYVCFRGKINVFPYASGVTARDLASYPETLGTRLQGIKQLATLNFIKFGLGNPISAMSL